MKFRGKMVEALCMRQFSNTISTLAKLGKCCIIRLTPDNLFFIMAEDSVPRRPLAWCELGQARFFTEYNVFGVSEQHNQIYLEFSPDLLSRALMSLKSPQTSKSIKIKLTNKKSPCLTCEIELPTLLQHSRICVHDIPVEVIPRREWSEYSEPTLPKFDVSVQLPNLKLVKNICERMKSLSQYILVSANRNGILLLKVETDLATVVTHFKDLIVEGKDSHENLEEEEMERYFIVRVDLKKLIGFLSCEQVSPTKVVCNVVEKKMLHMHVVHDDVTLHYFIPAIAK